MQKAVGALGLAVSVLVVPTAQGAEVVELDRTHGVRFTLDGRTLTVRLVPQQHSEPPDVHKEVWGKRIDAICAATFHPRSRRGYVRRIRLWPRGQPELRYRFGRDISDRVKWCLLEHNAADVAVVSFVRTIRVIGNTAEERRTGRRVRDRILRESAAAPWLPRVRAIVVSEGAVAVSTDLAGNRRGRRIARHLCLALWMSGIEDPPPGRPRHAVFGREDEVLATCGPSPGS